jgi:ribose-phosphate pyrophosphokinase
VKPILFSLFGSSEISRKIMTSVDVEMGDVTLHRFQDTECYVRINSDVNNREIILITSLDVPDEKILPLLFFSRTAKDLGAKKIGLIAPYLSYLRQDKRFTSGEGLTSRYFAAILSQFFDWLLTIDPHLHRYTTLNKIYSMPTFVIHATENIAAWIKMHVKNPILIGPDVESKQWVADIAEKANIPFLILEKIRLGDKDVEISIPDIQNFKSCVPVLVDDIISTARTMGETVKQLRNLEMKPAICIGVHGVFAEDAFQMLSKTGVDQIVTCNTIAHETNAIDVSDIIIDALKNRLIKKENS